MDALLRPHHHACHHPLDGAGPFATPNLSTEGAKHTTSRNDTT